MKDSVFEKIRPEIERELSTFEPDEVLPENEVAKKALTIDGIRLTILSQNTAKESRFAKLARSGHLVHWAIEENTGMWYLFVDGVFTPREKVAADGSLVR